MVLKCVTDQVSECSSYMFYVAKTFTCFKEYSSNDVQQSFSFKKRFVDDASRILLILYFFGISSFRKEFSFLTGTVINHARIL